MKKKKIILLVLLIILIIVGVSITLLYFFNNDVKELWKYSFESYDITNLPVDDGYDDNVRIYGGWNIEKIERYYGGKLKTSLITSDSVIQIYNNDKLQSCYIEGNDNDNLECVTANYALVNNILYVVQNDTYLSGKYDILFKDDYMILKTDISSNKEDYALLYFLKK